MKDGSDVIIDHSCYVFYYTTFVFIISFLLLAMADNNSISSDAFIDIEGGNFGLFMPPDRTDDYDPNNDDEYDKGNDPIVDDGPELDNEFNRNVENNIDDNVDLDNEGYPTAAAWRDDPKDMIFILN